MEKSADKYDVIIIGAGVSGLAATRMLNSTGFKTLTLEATDRIGGRIYTDRSTGLPIDLGAS
jgi:polyamine oxidase